jgi:hypothetical protein
MSASVCNGFERTWGLRTIFLSLYEKEWSHLAVWNMGPLKLSMPWKWTLPSHQVSTTRI